LNKPVAEVHQDAPYKSKRPPMLHFAEAQEGSTWPNDIPIKRNANTQDVCWTDITGALHLNTTMSEVVDTRSICVTCVNTPSSMLIPLSLASSEPTKPIYVHSTHSDGRDYHCLGEYRLMGNTPFVINNQKHLEINLYKIRSTVKPTKLDPFDSCSFLNKPPLLESYCCVGCGEGVGCFNRSAKRLKFGL
jgi:hypothetical protein